MSARPRVDDARPDAASRNLRWPAAASPLIPALRAPGTAPCCPGPLKPPPPPPSSGAVVCAGAPRCTEWPRGVRRRVQTHTPTPLDGAGHTTAPLDGGATPQRRSRTASRRPERIERPIPHPTSIQRPFRHRLSAEAVKPRPVDGGTGRIRPLDVAEGMTGRVRRPTWHPAPAAEAAQQGAITGMGRGPGTDVPGPRPSSG